MKSSEQIIQFILQRIGHIYFRPLMYGGTAEGVELLLHYYHELWAETFEKQEEYKQIRDRIYRQEDCGSGSLIRRFQEIRKNADGQSTSEYVVKHWRNISKELMLPVPYDTIRAFFKHNEKLSSLFLDE